MNEQADASGILKGELSDGTTTISIRGTREFAGSIFASGSPTGFEFFMNDTVIGAVEVINAGAVWIVASVEDELRSPLAVTASALLLYQDIGE